MKYISLDRFLLIGGKKGHLATMDWQNKKLGCEVHVQETVRDVRYRLYVSFLYWNVSLIIVTCKLYGHAKY